MHFDVGSGRTFDIKTYSYYLLEEKGLEFIITASYLNFI